ncbi:YafY family protein [Polynucleobacter sp. 80A-SIGWE]|uniref:helix-turn-helix transcriptional regulator n=1 Tax=Polynucleobacter sp. 80A-SIGWE TaxID=2689100 RepID=UPI0021022D8D|nr:WYL domain-containing protein [Polynucleobacter sp. 80A-SIGWE]
MERLHRIKYLIQARNCVPLNVFLDELEISKATFKRDLEYLRDRMNADIIYDRAMGGYRFGSNQSAGEKIELPGLWFSEEEATALVITQSLLADIDQGGLLGPHLEPLKNIIDGILGRSETTEKELRKRIKVFGMSARRSAIESFEVIGNALLKRERLHIDFYSKGKNQMTERDISPQRLIYYRDNWYLDAYCHMRKDLRSFAVDGIKKARIINAKADEISEKQLNEHFGESYGIFSGKATQKAKLKFTPERARWVASETWHKHQASSFDKDGNYILEFDYNQDPELIMDILKHGSEVEVLAPTSLRKKIKEESLKVASKY